MFSGKVTKLPKAVFIGGGVCVTWYSYFFLKETYVFKRQSSRQDKTGLPSWVHPRKPYQPSWPDGRQARQALSWAFLGSGLCSRPSRVQKGLESGLEPALRCSMQYQPLGSQLSSLISATVLLSNCKLSVV